MTPDDLPDIKDTAMMSFDLPRQFNHVVLNSFDEFRNYAIGN